MLATYKKFPPAQVGVSIFYNSYHKWYVQYNYQPPFIIQEVPEIPSCFDYLLQFEIMILLWLKLHNSENIFP